MQSFLIFQIFQAAHAMISMKQGPVNNLLASIHRGAIDKFRFHTILISSQAARAKPHSKNRWSLVSSTLAAHRTQFGPSSICQFLRTMRSFVFSLSLRSNQRNTRSLGRHLDFHMAWIPSSHGVRAKMNL